MLLQTLQRAPDCSRRSGLGLLGQVLQGLRMLLRQLLRLLLRQLLRLLLLSRCRSDERRVAVGEHGRERRKRL
jgi:hypothetical protein